MSAQLLDQYVAPPEFSRQLQQLPETRDLFVAIGIDCDPDRDTYPHRLTWRGIEAIPRLLDIPNVRWTFNVRADTQVRDYCGTAAYCWEKYRVIWDDVIAAGSGIAWHLHYFGADGRQDTSEANVVENVRVGSEALGHPDVVHMGWTYQSDFSIRRLAEAGVRVDYSPVPRVRFAGRNGVDAYDWSRFAHRPQYCHGVRMIPAFSCRHRLLAQRFGTERVILTTTTEPLLYRTLLADFFASGADFLVSYFHADELTSNVGGWRNHLYSYANLVRNIQHLRSLADRHEFRIRFVTVHELSGTLFAQQ